MLLGVASEQRKVNEINMSQMLTNSGDCCNPNSCADIDVQQIPGPQGPAGADGADGTDGTNAFTTTTANFTQPAVDANVAIAVVNSTWATVGQDLFIEGGGYYEVVSKADATHITVKNLGYDANAIPTATIPSGSQVGPAGEKGTDGTVDPSGALLVVNDLSDVASTATARTNLGLTSAATTALSSFLLKADNLSGLGSAATARTNLGVAIGTNVQAYNALLAALAGLAPTVADRFIYTTGVNTVAVSTLTALARTLLDDSTTIAMRSTLGSVLPRYGLLASLAAVDLNVATSDNAMTVESTRYRVDKLVVENASINLTAATAGLFTAAGGAGTTLAPDQALSALTASTKFDDLSLDAVTGTDVQTAGTIYFRVGTPQGAAATANVWLFGWTYA